MGYVWIDFDGEFDVHLIFVVASNVPGHLGNLDGNVISDTVVVSVDLFSEHVAGEGLINQRSGEITDIDELSIFDIKNAKDFIFSLYVEVVVFPGFLEH